MDYLEFVNKINELGVSIRSTAKEGEVKKYDVSYGLASCKVKVENLDVSFTEKQYFGDALDSLITRCVDIDSWKHSWHTPINEENYLILSDIIQKKIISRAEEIEMLLTTYFAIAKKLSNSHNKKTPCMENKDIALHLAQDSEDFVNNIVTIRLSYETSDSECSNIFAVVKRIDSTALDNILEMEAIIESMKIDLINKVNKKTP